MYRWNFEATGPWTTGVSPPSGTYSCEKIKEKSEGWMDISTAPKRGEYLVYQPQRKSGRILLEPRIVLNASAGYSRPTTHWMPLPTPPKDAE